MAGKKKNDPFYLDEEPIVNKKKKTPQNAEKPKDDEEEYPFENGDDDFEYEDLMGDEEFPGLPEDLYNLIGIIEEYALSESENALWRAYAAVEDSPDLETAKKKIRALIRKLG